jgi:AAA15 family ATPase/GTPase
MLVEFRVKNFRSFRDEQVLSFVATNDKSFRDTNTIMTGRNEAPFLLRSAVLYGANGSGKSNLISALQLMRELVISSSSLRMEPGFDNIQPFKLDEQSVHEPTEFEVTLIKYGVRYQYGFAITRHRIVSEHLLVYKTAKAERWFERHYDPAIGKDVYEFSAYLKAAKYLWEDHPRPDSLFLSTAILLKDPSMRPVYDWFENELFITNEQSRINFMDLYLISRIASEGLTTVIDDIETKLHKLMMVKLMQMLHSSYNMRGSQLLFTTSLTEFPALFRRDQIWLLDKNQEQVSTLIWCA